MKEKSGIRDRAMEKLMEDIRTAELYTLYRRRQESIDPDYPN